MTCGRCDGQMTHETLHGFGEDLVWAFSHWRCIYCGEIIDPVILANRGIQKKRGPSIGKRLPREDKPKRPPEADRPVELPRGVQEYIPDVTLEDTMDLAV